MTGNDFAKFFLRTPLYVFMGDTMLITVTGCKTGKKYTTPGCGADPGIRSSHPHVGQVAGVRLKNGEPHPEDAACLAKERLFVQVQMKL